jgi:predicted nucleic acid-binding protein
VQELRRLIGGHRVQMIGPIRQELLSGIRDEAQFSKLAKLLQAFPDLPLLTEDYVTVARYFNACRRKGVQGSKGDFLICAISVRHRLPIFTTDRDFDLFVDHLPIVLYHPQRV